jgi:hypothetical protein
VGPKFRWFVGGGAATSGSWYILVDWRGRADIFHARTRPAGDAEMAQNARKAREVEGPVLHEAECGVSGRQSRELELMRDTFPTREVGREATIDG